MEVWPAILVLTELLFLTQALDDDEARKYTVSFFQFNSKDLGVTGPRPGHSKKDFKRGVVDNSPKTNTNNTIAGSNSTVESNNAIPANETGESSTNATTNSMINQTESISNATIPSSNTSASIANNTDTTADNDTTAARSLNSTVDTPSGSITTSGGTGELADINIMNTLIEMAKKKNYTRTRNIDGKPKSVDIELTGSFNAQNTTIKEPKLVVRPSNSTSNATADSRDKKSVVPAAPAEYTGPHRKDLLNPNPKPSETEAQLNLKKPSPVEGIPHDAAIHAENTTKVETSETKEAITTNNVSMVKNEIKDDKMAEHVVELSAAEKEKLKIAKDKQTNKEIQENAKSIQPVTNTVGSMNSTMTGIQDNTPKSQVEQSPEKIKHRKKVAQFVPLYKTSPKDQRLSFQIGSLKHPKHSIHPKCHVCPATSSYKECVKKSTLQECNKGLNNICFTKSSKKNGLITYQMGCADHNKCVKAKAFPCKDGHEKCFTCCQYDRCNSSPHHGDYELDELNLDELTNDAAAQLTGDNSETTKLDSSTAVHTIGSSWITYACTAIAVLALHL